MRKLGKDLIPYAIECIPVKELTKEIENPKERSRYRERERKKGSQTERRREIFMSEELYIVAKTVIVENERAYVCKGSISIRRGRR